LKKSVTDISADTEHFVKKIGSRNSSCWGDDPTLKQKTTIKQKSIIFDEILLYAFNLLSYN